MNRNIIISSLKGSGALLAAVSLASCSASGSSPQGVSVKNPLSGILQMSVGSANIFGDDPTAAVVGTNVAVTFRQPKGGTEPGGTAALVNTPTLSGPWTLPANVSAALNTFGSTIAISPAPTEAGGTTMTATAQLNAGTPTTSIPLSTFGVSTGVTGSGLEPYNYSATGGSTTGSGGTNFGVPDSYVPYAVPVYDPMGAADPNRARPWGGPPAFDPDKDGKGTRDASGYPAGVLGVEEGLDVFEGAGPTAGSYALSVTVPTSASAAGTLSTTATMASAALLPAVSYLTATPTPDGAGGGTFPVVLPAGVTEEYLQITDYGPTTSDAVSCNGASPTTLIYYTIFANASGNYTLPDTDGPGLPGSTTPTLCTPAQNATASAGDLVTGDPTPDGDEFTVQVYGFDYPAYESAYPQSNGNPSPTLPGANGQSDITISSAADFTQPVAAEGDAARAQHATPSQIARLRALRSKI